MLNGVVVQLLCERTSWGLGLGWQTIWRLLRACLLPQFLRSFALVSFGGAEVIFKLRASVECCVHIAVVHNFDDIAPMESALLAKKASFKALFVLRPTTSTNWDRRLID